MKTKLKFLTFLLLISSTTLWAQNITRLVFFNLKHEAGTPEAVTFFEKTQILGEVPSVSHFGVLRVEGKSFDYDYVIRLGFEDEEGVDVYVKHSIHTDYLAGVWKSNVSGGMMIDMINMEWDGKLETYYFDNKDYKPLLTRGL